MDELERGGFTDEGKFVFGGVVFREVFGAWLAGFFAHKGNEIDGDGAGGEVVEVVEETDEHGGHGAFGVGGAATPDFVVLDFGGKGVDGHSGDADGIEVGAEEDAGAVFWAWAAGDEVGAVGENFFEGYGEAVLGEEVFEVGGDLGFASVW